MTQSKADLLQERLSLEPIVSDKDALYRIARDAISALREAQAEIERLRAATYNPLTHRLVPRGVTAGLEAPNVQGALQAEPRLSEQAVPTEEWKQAAFAFAETFLSTGSYAWTPSEWLSAVQARASHQAPQRAAPDSLNASPVVPRKSDSHPATVAGLLPCPCGRTPDDLLIVAEDREKWGYVSGSCCGEWTLEFRLQYLRSNDPERVVLAREAWNKAGRAQPQHPVTDDHDTEQPRSREGKDEPDTCPHSWADGCDCATPKPESETVALLWGMRPYAERIMKYSQAGCRTLDEMMRGMESVSDNARALLARIDAALTTKEQKDLGRDRPLYATPKPESETVALLREARNALGNVTARFETALRRTGTEERYVTHATQEQHDTIAAIDAALSTKEQK